MTNETRMTKSEQKPRARRSFVIRASSFIRHSSFVIRHSSLHSHPLGNFYSQQLQSFHQHAASQLAEGESRVARRFFRFQDGTGFVEAVKRVRQFVEIIREQVWAKVVQDGRNDFRELAEFQRKTSLLRS